LIRLWEAVEEEEEEEEDRGFKKIDCSPASGVDGNEIHNVPLR
jgi:hypothetical protein